MQRSSSDSSPQILFCLKTSTEKRTPLHTYTPVSEGSTKRVQSHDLVLGTQKTVSPAALCLCSSYRIRLCTQPAPGSHLLMPSEATPPLTLLCIQRRTAHLRGSKARLHHSYNSVIGIHIVSDSMSGTWAQQCDLQMRNISSGGLLVITWSLCPLPPLPN